MEWLKCPDCGKPHPWKPGARPCPNMKSAAKPVATPKRSPRSPAAQVSGKPTAVSESAPTADKPNDGSSIGLEGHRIYMREYMRKYRERKKK